MSERGNVRAACAAVGFSPEAAYKLRRREAAFAGAWDAALVLAREFGEQVLATRAIDGIMEDVYYRGDYVGTRIRHDTRLLLAHLGRLDRRAEAPFAQARAARFDEMLALVAGLTPPDRDGSTVLAAEGRGAPGDDPLLPPARDRFVTRAGWAAETEVREIAEEEAWAVEDREDAGPDSPQGVETEQDRAEREEAEAYALDAAAAAARDAARAAAAARWDAWAAQAVALADEMAGGPPALDPDLVHVLACKPVAPMAGEPAGEAVAETGGEPEGDRDSGDSGAPEDGEIEYKSLGGRGGMTSLDTVHCVNFAPRRGARGTPPRSVAPFGRTGNSDRRLS